MTGWEHSDEAQAYGRGILTGDHTYLRPLRETDLADLERWWADPAVSVLQNSTVRPQPDGPAADKFRAWSLNADSSGVGFSIATRSDDRLIGHVVLYGATVAARGATLAIILGPDSVGQGFGTDALRLIVRYGFHELGLHRIGLQVWSYNSRALSAYRKVGFVEEGRRREVVFHQGRFYDEVLMGLLASEWQDPSAG